MGLIFAIIFACIVGYLAVGYFVALIVEVTNWCDPEDIFTVFLWWPIVVIGFTYKSIRFLYREFLQSLRVFKEIIE